MSSYATERHRSRTQGDPVNRSGSLLTLPYTVHRPTPLREQSRPRTPSVERSFVHPQTSPPDTRSPSSHHHTRHASGTVRLPPPLVEDLPPPPRSATNVHHRTHYQNGDVTHGSHHTRQHSSASVTFQNPTHVHSGFPSPITTHHVALPPRSRPGPPSAASHRYASTITPPVYGHGSSASNASRTSINAATHSHRHHHASVSHHAGYVPPESPQRSRSHVRAPSASPSRTTATAVPVHDAMEIFPSPPSSDERGMIPSHKLHRSTYRPPLPANYDSEIQTRYVRMLLALEAISPVFNALAAFFTWILLAGFLLFPGTFATLKNNKSSVLVSVVDHIPLYTIAWICTGVGGCGMIWLWWKWYKNYIWINNRIFIPGCLNSTAGIVSTLANVYGTQGGAFGKSEKSTIIVTGAISLICGILVVVHTWQIRRLRKEHDHEIGHEVTGKHGEGFLGEKRELEDGVIAAQTL